MSAEHIAYAVVGGVVAIGVGAWQRAELAGPTYARHRKHEAECTVCEAPGWFWWTGYQCYECRWRGYPFVLSPVFGLLAAAVWPVAAGVCCIAIAQRKLAAKISARLDARALARQDELEVERLLGNLP